MKTSTLAILLCAFALLSACERKNWKGIAQRQSEEALTRVEKLEARATQLESRLAELEKRPSPPAAIPR